MPCLPYVPVIGNLLHYSLDLKALIQDGMRLFPRDARYNMVTGISCFQLHEAI